MTDTAPTTARTRRRVGARWKLLAALTGTLLILAPLGWFWWQSLIPGTYSVMSMGYADYGGGPTLTAHGASHGAHHGVVSVADLVGPDRPADVTVELDARAEKVELGGDEARTVDGFTLNHQSPGPTIEVRQGELLEVMLVNVSVPDGVTLHWHGVDVPNGEDGVAGVTQDAVDKGESFTYRFVAEDPGTYWYHSHQVSDEQVRKGLFGALVVLPATPRAAGSTGPVAIVHSYSGYRTINGQIGEVPAAAEAGDDVRVRVVNSNNGPLRTWVAGSSYRVLAVDARGLHGPQPVTDKVYVVPAGGRVDLGVTVPADGTGVRIEVGGGTSLVVGPEGATAPEVDEPEDELDLLSYGTPAPIGFDTARPDRRFEYRIGRRLGFMDGRPGFWWTINGHLFPDVPMYMVAEGDVVQMTLENSSGQIHPMHLHGHHAVVLSRNGEPSTGSPWWVDSLDVEDGETYVIAFVADNPGVWMDHCHNLPHANQGLVAHLMYEGVTTPFKIGGDHDNDPE